MSEETLLSRLNIPIKNKKHLLMELPSNSSHVSLIKKHIATIQINNKKLLPSWCKQPIKFPISDVCNKNTKNADVSINIDGKEFDFLKIDNNNKKIEINNFEYIIDNLLFERYFVHKRPLFTKLPFSYNLIPPFFRNMMRKTNCGKDTNTNFKNNINMNTNMKTKISSNTSINNTLNNQFRFPAWPVEPSVDVMRHLLEKALEIKTGRKIKHWPNNNKCCFIATHDMETETSFRNISVIREIEKRHNFNSSWNVLSKKYNLNFKKLNMLVKDGCEIGIHGYNHDGKLSFLNKKCISKRLNHAKNTFARFNPTSFRSPILMRNEHFLKELSNYFECDSSVPDTDIFSPLAKRSGCCTVFPFMINNMVEVPLTLPQDYRLIYSLNLNEKKMFNLWKEKADYIYEAGGIINILTHPDDYLTGNETYLRVYERLLYYISKKDDVYHDTISNVTKGWKEKNNDIK